jgi:hypothetical protein
MRMFALVLALAVVPAYAALADGFRQIPWGKSLEVTDVRGDCTRHGEKTDASYSVVCTDTIGSTPVTIMYYDAQVGFHSLNVAGDTFNGCAKLYAAFRAAYGEGRAEPYGALPDRRWHGGAVNAAWSYNKYTDTCSFLMWHTPTRDAFKRANDAQGRAASADL